MNVLKLFKYYAPKYENEDNISFYSQRSIYFQRPTKFNDPWDCKAPPITVPRQINSLKDIWFNLAKPGGIVFTNTEWQKIRKLPRAEIKLRFGNLFKEAFDKLRSKIGVFSLSFIPDSELMWSHYASSHSGFVLHFQIDIAEYRADSSLKNVGIPIPVIYRDKRGGWNLGNYYNNRETHIYDLIRFKSNAWAHECELRFLNKNEYGFIKTPSNWLKSIIIGINADSNLREKLKQIGNKLNVSVFSAVMNKEEYKIDIPGLGIDGNDGRNRYKEVIDSRIFES